MYSKLKELLVEEMDINADLINPDAELMNDLGFNSLELADLVSSAKKDSTSCSTKRRFPVFLPWATSPLISKKTYDNGTGALLSAKHPFVLKLTKEVRNAEYSRVRGRQIA